METPPRAWGRPPVAPKPHPAQGNTPTCVGKTQLMRSLSIESEKHPHVRGEDGLALALLYRNPETPPRAWGRRRCLAAVSPRGRNTPTCVGKTSTPAAAAARIWKHPHVRGEDQK